MRSTSIPIVKRWMLIAFILVLILLISIIVWAHWTDSPADILARYPSNYVNVLSRTDANLIQMTPLSVIVDTTDSNPFASYILEILKAEGLFSFDPINLVRIDADSFDCSYSKLIVTVTKSQKLVRLKNTLVDYVHGGGRLVMIDPPTEFDSILGIHNLNHPLQDGYIQFDSTSAVSSGLSTIPLQFFGSARICSSTTSTVFAQFLDSSRQSNYYPAVGLNYSEKGRVAYFLYDLARTIVFTRQGKPPGVIRDLDNDGVLRTTDLFYHTLDYSRNRIPQGDLQQKLLVRIIEDILGDTLLIPRAWYFPNGENAIAIITGDAHYTATDVTSRLVEYVEARGGRYSLIDYPDVLDTVYAGYLRAHGHSVGPHIYAERLENKFPLRIKLWISNWGSKDYFFHPRFQDLSDETDFAVECFKQRTGINPTFTRTHFLSWWGWSEMAEMFAQHHLVMDLSVTGMNPNEKVTLPLSSDVKSPVGFGYINGSGLPMRFVNERGQLINLFEQPTQVEDDVIGAGFVTDPPNDSLTIKNLIDANRSLIDESIEHYHTALVYNFHPEHTISRFPFNTPPTWDWITAIVDYLAQRKVPMLSLDTWLSFVVARSNIEVTPTIYDDQTQNGTFVVSSREGVNGLTFLLRPPVKRTNLKSARASILPLKEPLFSVPISRMSVNGLTYDQIKMNIPPLSKILIEFSY